MSTRRKSSTSSLAKFARIHSPDLSNRSLDFCNAFWGLADGGVDVLFARMRGGARTMEELKNFWKERSSIEEDYAKRMSKLAKMTLGKDEIGELRNSLDTLRLETDKQAGFHLQLSQQIRTDLEGQTTAFYNKQMHHKKAYQAGIEKEFKDKQTQESYVNKAREKYESDCLRINSYTAQSTLVQGKELEKLHLKLERAQLTVQANERDYLNFSRALGESTQKWEQDWKSFCDSCQDLEEDRMEFMKDNLWAYANAVSTVCVSDDESCEKMRLALEQMEPDRDMENFVRDYGTGNAIPDPPAFVNYTTPDAISSSSSRPTTRPAHFNRSSQRQTSTRAPPPEPDEPFVNTAGVGAGGGGRRGDSQSDAGLNRSGTVGSSRGRHVNGAGSVNGHGSSSSSSTPQNIQRRPTNASQPQSFKPSHDPQAEPIDPTADTFIKVGPNAYKVDLSKDPQQGGSGSASGHGRAAVAVQNGGGAVDPLAKQMEALKHAATGSISVRRNSTYNKPPPSRQGTAEAPTSGPSALSPPAGSSGGGSAHAAGHRPKDYRNSAEIVVGSYPGSSRPSSPSGAPTPSFMVPPSQRPVSPAAHDLPVEDVVADYGRPLPGERRKSISRPNSRNSHHGPGQGPGPSSNMPSHSHSHNQGPSLERPVSRTGHPGIGAHGGSRSSSPVAGHKVPPSSGQPLSGVGYNRAGPQRANSPNPVGVALGPDGNVTMDIMADRFRQQQQHQQSPATQYISPSQTPGAPTRRQSYIAVPPTQPPYGPPPVANYRPPQQQQQPYPQQPPPQQPYNPPPTQQYPGQQQQPIYPSQPPAQGGYTPPNGAGVKSNPSYTGYSGGAARPHQVQPPVSQVPYYPDQPSPSPMPPQQPQHQAPPTGQTTEDGRGILFYVKALYDYSATIEEEFDFQSGDIIAVTATPEDGWWSGELLDEARRQPGRHVFPSNFVCLF